MPDVYWNTDVAPGGIGTPADPYASWNEAWEAEDVNILPGETWNFYATGLTEDLVAPVIDGLPTSGAPVTINFFPWHTEFGAESDHPNGWYRGNGHWSTAHYRHRNNTANNVLVNFTSNTIAHVVRFQGLQIANNRTVVSPKVIQFQKGLGSNGTTLYLDQCRLWLNTMGSANPRIIRGESGSSSSDSGGRANIRSSNCLMIYSGTNNCSAYNLNSTFGTKDAVICNTTVIYDAGGEDFIDDVDGWECTLLNNVADATAGGQIKMDLTATGGVDFVGTTATVNAADRVNGGFAVSKTGDFVDHAGRDYRPAVSQTNAWGTGGTTNADNPLIPTVDIRGFPRNTGAGQNTAIGCFAGEDEGPGGQIGNIVPNKVGGVEINTLALRTAGNSTLNMVANAQIDGALEVWVNVNGETAVLTWDGTEYTGPATAIAAYLSGRVGLNDDVEISYIPN